MKFVPLCAILALCLCSCATPPDQQRPRIPVSIGYTHHFDGGTVAAGYSTAGGIAVNVSDK